LISNRIEICYKEVDIEASSLRLQHRYDTILLSQIMMSFHSSFAGTVSSKIICNKLNTAIYTDPLNVKRVATLPREMLMLALEHCSILS